MQLGGVEAGSWQTSLTCRDQDPDREPGLEIRARWLPQPRPSPRRDTKAKGCGGCSPRLETPGLRSPAPYSPLLPPGAIDLAGSEGQLEPTPELRVREAPPLSATLSHKSLREIFQSLRLRSLLRFSELCRRGPARTSASNPRLACRLPGTSPSPGDPVPRRPNFWRAICAPRLSSSCAKGRAGFRGPATLSPSARLPPTPAWG